MTIVISDPALLTQLTRADKVVEIRDPGGSYIGTFSPPVGKPPPGYKAPLSDAEVSSRRGVREGKSLTEILKTLQGK